MSHIRDELGQLAARRSNAIAMAWLAITFLWVIVIFATDLLAWPIVIWIATTIGPIKALGESHKKLTEQPQAGAQKETGRTSLS